MAGDVRASATYGERVDVVFHLAASVGNGKFSSQPHEGYDVNVNGTLAVLNYCHRVGAKCILSSTSGVYRPTENQELISEDSPIGPDQPYNISKWLAESVCRQQANDLDVLCVVLRIFNAYGPGQHPSFIVGYVLECLASGSPIILRSPQASRDFIYMDDVVDAFVKASERQAGGVSTFNIGSGIGTKVNDLVRVAEGLHGAATKIEMPDPEAGRESSFVADITLAARELNWSPQYDLRRGLAAITAQSG